jgi:hypothetical protein
MREDFPLDVHGTHPVAEALATGTPRVMDEPTDRGTLGRAAQDDEYMRFVHAAGYGSAAVFPLIARGRTRGAISFLRLRNDTPFRPGQLALLEDLTSRAAMAYDNARLYAQRARVARTLQRSLMPAVLPQIAGLELASCFRPMSTSDEVGGDFYDVFGDKKDCWLVVGDVCGKGADAAALTGFLRHTTVAHALEGMSPGKVLSHVNRAMLSQDFHGRFATVILAHLRFLQPEVEVTIAAAGHPAALVARAGGAVEQCGRQGTLLGVFSDPVIEEASTILGPGDVLALYTDGLLEAHAPRRTVTVAELIEQLRQVRPRFAQDTIDVMLGLVGLGDDVRDDIAILAARMKAHSSDGAARRRASVGSRETLEQAPG